MEKIPRPFFGPRSALSTGVYKETTGLAHTFTGHTKLQTATHKCHPKHLHILFHGHFSYLQIPHLYVVYVTYLYVTPFEFVH